MSRRSVTIVVHADGALERRQYRIPLWAFEVGRWGALVLALLIALFFAFAGPITRNAAQVPSLRREITRLETENARVQQLAAALNRAEENYQAVRQLLGGGAAEGRGVGGRGAPAGRDGAAQGMMRAAVVRAGRPAAPPRYTAGPSVPAHWPLDVSGFITRGQVGPGTPGESHTGLDIAVAEGTPVRASGGGTVIAAGSDPDYGLFVRLRHPDGYESMYGHASRLLVRDREEVRAGQVIALSGSTGRSTAPHVHFEIRRGGRTVDPLSLVKEGS